MENKSLVILQNNTPITTTKIISEQTGVLHRNVKRLIDRHEEDFTEFGAFKKPQKLPKDNTLDVYYLNEEHALFLITLMRNNETVTNLKKQLVKQFVTMRKWILEQETMQANEAYKQQRLKGKNTRLQETNIIKEFIEYAKSQGSTSAEKYYMIISKMENQAFFILKEKFPNVREILNMEQLAKIEFADIVVKNAIIEGMNAGIGYKDIYKLAKEKVIDASNTLGCKDILPTFNILNEAKKGVE
jgi:phage regulator Rha-like protein